MLDHDAGRPYPYAGVPGSAPSSGGMADHRVECCGSIPDRARRAALSGGHQATASTRSATPSPARSCTRCAAARWRHSARFRSRVITARRFHAALRHAGRAYFERTGDLETLAADLAQHRGRAALDRESTATAMATASSNMPRSDKGLANQGWKDSADSVFHADGRLADGPIALCEVQAYVYAAYLGAARIGRGARPAATRAAELEDAGRRLCAQRFEVVSGARISGPMPWRSMAPSGPAGFATPMPAMRCWPASPAGARAPIMAQTLMTPRCFFAAGASAPCRDGGALQSDVLSQRLGLAARQCADRAGIGALRVPTRSGAAIFEGLFEAAATA